MMQYWSGTSCGLQGYLQRVEWWSVVLSAQNISISRANTNNPEQKNNEDYDETNRGNQCWVVYPWEIQGKY